MDNYSRNQKIGIILFALLVMSLGLLSYQVLINSSDIDSSNSDFTVSPECTEVEYTENNDKLKDYNHHK